ncbi:MAG TPA: GNAT family N-acetyltransferase [Bryobacteraceae bacterium]|nr:GNAT family N-acetyltransferase [Bryobacteraceae bacterium]
MAALADTPFLAVDLRSLELERLTPVLNEQIETWKAELDWDFTQSASLVRRFVQIHALTGNALVLPGYRGEVAGYSYYVCEEGKGLVGDLYLRHAYRSEGTERALLQASLDALFQTPGVRRVESQLLMLGDSQRYQVPYQTWLKSFPRLFLESPLSAVFPARRLPSSISVVPWTGMLQEATGRLIAGSYRNHIDSEINDQYRSAIGARRFLTNIVQYPGCGSFFAPASFAAFTGDALCGASLASLVAADVGHVTQVCVAPSYQGIGLGYELMRRSMEALARHGCRAVSLTVTVANEAALGLYRNMGFAPRRAFNAYVWEPES